MQNKPVAHVRLNWRDRDGNRARTTLYVPFATNLDALALEAIETIEILKGVSNAVVESFEIVLGYDLSDRGSLVLGDALNSTLALYYGNVLGGTEGLYIPAPRMEILESYGRYAAIRLDGEHPLAEQLLEALADGIDLGFVAGPDGTLYDTIFLVGGLTL